MKNFELIKILQAFSEDEEIEFVVYGHTYNPRRQKTSHGAMTIEFVFNNYSDRVLRIGRN